MCSLDFYPQIYCIWKLVHVWQHLHTHQLRQRTTLMMLLSLKYILLYPNLVLRSGDYFWQGLTITYQLEHVHIRFYVTSIRSWWFILSYTNWPTEYYWRFKINQVKFISFSSLMVDRIQIDRPYYQSLCSRHSVIRFTVIKGHVCGFGSLRIRLWVRRCYHNTAHYHYLLLQNLKWQYLINHLLAKQLPGWMPLLPLWKLCPV